MTPDHAPSPEPRELSDPQVLRALTHPLRLALLELLRIDGELTAAQAGRRLDESQASCSFHLRQLARFGFVEPVPGAHGRARPWRLSGAGMRSPNVYDDPAADLAWTALEDMLRSRLAERDRRWIETRGTYPRHWREAAFVSQHVAWLTPLELGQLAERVTALLVEMFPERRGDPGLRPAEALPVQLLATGYPLAADRASADCASAGPKPGI